MHRPSSAAYEGAGAAGAITLSCLLVFGWMYETLPFDGRVTDGDTLGVRVGSVPQGCRSPVERSPTGGPATTCWATRAGRSIRSTTSSSPRWVTSARTDGCGRALWENNSDNGEYGTTMALMLLPHWTDGCIASMEGLFFEASGTTPYHFLTAAAMSKQSSNPVRQLRYVNNDAEVGVQHMHDLGVRYLMVRTDEAKAEARAQEDLELVDDVGAVGDLRAARRQHRRAADRAAGRGRGRGGDQRERNLEVGTSWFQRQEDWAALPADDGPDEWQRVPVEVDLSARVGEPGDRSRNVDYVVPAEPIEPVALDPVTVSNVDVEEQSISFEVDQVGVPVLVRVSYFPTWKVEGADGPYRVAPNLMVVVPDEQRGHADATRRPRSTGSSTVSRSSGSRCASTGGAAAMSTTTASARRGGLRPRPSRPPTGRGERPDTRGRDRRLAERAPSVDAVPAGSDSDR